MPGASDRPGKGQVRPPAGAIEDSRPAWSQSRSDSTQPVALPWTLGLSYDCRVWNIPADNQSHYQWQWPETEFKLVCSY